MEDNIFSFVSFCIFYFSKSSQPSIFKPLYNYILLSIPPLLQVNHPNPTLTPNVNYLCHGNII